MKKLVVVIIGLIMGVSAQASLYRWVDDTGNVHFSDKVPVSASSKSHSKLNKSGDVTAEIDPELKQKKLDLKKAAKREKEQLIELRKIKADAQAETKKRDDDLLATYDNENELVRFFENKIKLVKGNTKILEAQEKVLNNRIVRLEDTAINTTEEANLKNIASKIVNINSTLKQYKQALRENEKQIIQLSGNYHNNLTRYQELTN